MSTTATEQPPDPLSVLLARRPELADLALVGARIRAALRESA